MVRELTAKAMAQTPMLGKLSDSPLPHRMWLRLQRDIALKTETGQFTCPVSTLNLG
ncbi:hypothetical protein H6G89_12295 [Oscillatoria sp. FACHB-1407]|uniref:hypothetical protein n=1 Tax=Oscillatoria sp. FACHB-1407 TaxID=2692847 RepID=UPI00168423FB|nr:hypothetical protein [Oscillatoria sp. FACHB-1407]MBD2461829.1 hypothetical protein [Oscillatoria sp. FACHB-1407]